MEDKRLPEALVAAERHLRRVRGDVMDVDEGDADAGVALQALSEHWREHGETYEAAAKIVLDQLRVELLAQLYGWREQVSRQLEAQRRIRQASPRTKSPDRQTGSRGEPGTQK